MHHDDVIRFEGIHCEITISRPAESVILLTFAGHDIGELGNAPFIELEKHLAAEGNRSLFIDARKAKGASADVGGTWAVWLARHKTRFDRVCMLPGSRFIHMSAGLVQRTAELGEKMRLYTDPATFDLDLTQAIAADAAPFILRGEQGTIFLTRPAPGVLLFTFEGVDTGENNAPLFAEMEKHLDAHGPLDLFVDARNGRAASLGVSQAWASWLGANRARLRSIQMLTGSRFLQFSASFVRDFANLGEIMFLFTDPAPFEQALTEAISRSGPQAH